MDFTTYWDGVTGTARSRPCNTEESAELALRRTNPVPIEQPDDAVAALAKALGLTPEQVAAALDAAK